MEALIDGDIIVYSVGFASDQRSYKVGTAEFKYKADALEYCNRNGIELSEIQQEVVPEPLEYCLHSVKQLINSVLKDTGAEKFTIYLTGEGNFREGVATIKQYKGNRDPSHKPHWYAEIKEYLKDVWEAEVIDGKEADDAMGIRQSTSDGDTIICSIDKDMDMIPGLHFNWRTKRRYSIDEQEAMKNFYKQLLTGDAVDNIRGVPGIGKVRADRLLDGLQTEKEMFDVVLRAYYDNHVKEAEGTAIDYDSVVDELMENAKLLWIWRKENDEWQPPTESSSNLQTEPTEITFVVT